MAEKEYIEREALIDALMMYTWRDEDDREIDDSDQKRKFIEEWFPNIPASDVRPVVRCRECRLSYEWENVDGEKHRYCGFLRIKWNRDSDRMVEDDDFCSLGIAEMEES